MTEYKLPVRKDFINKIIEVPDFPELQIRYLDAENNLCPSHYNGNIRCFWEGDLNVTLDVNGNQITINDHDQKKGNVNIVSVHDVQYIFQGIRPHIINDSRDQTYLIFTIKKMAKNQTSINVNNYSMRTII